MRDGQGIEPRRPLDPKPSVKPRRGSSVSSFSNMTVDSVLQMADPDWAITDSLKSALEDILVSLGTMKRSNCIDSTAVTVTGGGRWRRNKVPMKTPKHVAAKSTPLLRLHCEEDRSRVRAFNNSRAKEVIYIYRFIYILRKILCAFRFSLFLDSNSIKLIEKVASQQLCRRRNQREDTKIADLPLFLT